MFSLVGFSESLDPAAAYVNHAAIPDQIATVSGDYIYIPEQTPNIIGAWAGADGTIENAAYFSSPSLRGLADYDIVPIEDAIGPVNGDCVILHPQSPLLLDPGEGIECLIKANPGAATVNSAILILADGTLAPITGDIFKVLFTAGITETVSVWTNGPITLRQRLPVGRYAIVGAQAWGTSGVAFRFVFKNQAARPGMICTSSEGEQPHPLSRNGGLAIWGEFDSRQLPDMEWLANATAGTTQTGVLDLIKIG